MKRVFVCVMSLLIAGCATQGPTQEQVSDEQQMSSVLHRIDSAMDSAVKAQHELAMTADAKMAEDALRRKRLLTDAVSYDFYGDVEDILKDIANKYAYTFEVYGKRPPERVNVNVYVTNKPVIDVLKQIGYQSTWIDIKLTKTAIELHYKEHPER